jgi:predicted  nucleic acid-binding Zn-ribbon protein
LDIAFDQLIKLQHIDTDTRANAAVLDSIPARIEAIDREIQATAAIVAQAKDKLAANQKKRRDLEGEVKEIRTHAAKFKRQLNDVKTNKEYSALQKEIEDTEHKAGRLEEEILNEMIAADDIEREIKAAGARQSEEKGRIEKDRTVILAEKAEHETRKAELEREREDVLPLIPPDQLKIYLRIAKRLNGAALSLVTDDFCSICQMRVRPQVLNDLLGRNALIACEACGRILYAQRSADEEHGPVTTIVDDPDKVDDSEPDAT